VLGVDIDVHQKNPSTFVCHGSMPSAVVSLSLHHRVPLAFLCGDLSRHRCDTLCQAGASGLPALAACPKLQRRRIPMAIAVAQQCLREHEHAVLVTWRRDGRLHMAPVTVGLDGAGRAIISRQETTDTVAFWYLWRHV
jgi:hypothetical protein